MKRNLAIGLGVLLVLVVGVGLAFASDASPTKEPESSPFFEATLQQAVDELDRKVPPPPVGLNRPAGAQAEVEYTEDPGIWIQCTPGYTRDEAQWPICHYTTDTTHWPLCDTEKWPTIHYTDDPKLWPNACGTTYTQEPAYPLCDPEYTSQPRFPRCVECYTSNVDSWPWCQPRWTDDPLIWPTDCAPGIPHFTENTSQYPVCNWKTIDPLIWPGCHYTSDAVYVDDCKEPWPTLDYTNNPQVWEHCPDEGYTTDYMRWGWCSPDYTLSPTLWPDDCTAAAPTVYTEDVAKWPWCVDDPLFTSDPRKYAYCHYTSDATEWADCAEPWPTMHYTSDPDFWKACNDPAYTQMPQRWPWCAPAYTHNSDTWPWCDPMWTRDPASMPWCTPGFTEDPVKWPNYCTGEPYTYDTTVFDWCGPMYTVDASIWFECHYTSDALLWKDCYEKEPTQDWTQNPSLFGVMCDPEYTEDPKHYPRCTYTEDPLYWADACTQAPQGDLGDAPDSTNHTAGGTMTAYPLGGPLGTQANFPTVFDPATGAPQGPIHWYPRADAWLGPWATIEVDADQTPDEDGVTNIDPPNDMPDQDGADDGLLYPVDLKDCQSTVISYSVTVAPGAPPVTRFVNLWLDYNRDGDWADSHTCTQANDAPEWAVQNQPVVLGPGTWVVQTPTFLPYNKNEDDPIWLRISIADMPAPRDPASGIVDGQGSPNGYWYGETEDYYIVPEPDPDYDIYIKDSDVDDGTVPSSSPYWTSPDIVVRNDGDCTDLTHENPTAGSNTTVCIRVRNRLSTTVQNTTVNLYWASAALGLSWPGSYNPVGNFNIASLPGLSETVQSVSWSVPALAGHFCLLARADSPPHDPIGSGPDTQVPTDLTQNNNNIAQRNSNVVNFTEIKECGFYSTTVQTETVIFDAVNTEASPTKVDIIFDSSDFPLGTGTFIVDPGSLWGDWTSLSNFNQSGNTLIPTAFPATMVDVQMAPNETARMSMTLAAEIDVRFTVEVEETWNDESVGGITYVRSLPRCVYLPIIMKETTP
jgi:hypothetical protein